MSASSGGPRRPRKSSTCSHVSSCQPGISRSRSSIVDRDGPGRHTTSGRPHNALPATEPALGTRRPQPRAQRHRGRLSARDATAPRQGSTTATTDAAMRHPVERGECVLHGVAPRQRAHRPVPTEHRRTKPRRVLDDDRRLARARRPGANDKERSRRRRLHHRTTVGRERRADARCRHMIQTVGADAREGSRPRHRCVNPTARVSPRTRTAHCAQNLQVRRRGSDIRCAYTLYGQLPATIPTAHAAACAGPTDTAGAPYRRRRRSRSRDRADHHVRTDPRRLHPSDSHRSVDARSRRSHTRVRAPTADRAVTRYGQPRAPRLVASRPFSCSSSQPLPRRQLRRA